MAEYKDIYQDVYRKRLESRKSVLKEQVLNDPLTGLYNRRGFMLLATKLLNFAQRERFPTSAMMMDIDFFKRINDQYGHEGGDLVLKEISRLLNPEKEDTLVRKSDLIGRWGGEEIVFFLPNTDLDGAQKVAEKIKDQMAKTQVKIHDKEKASFTVTLVWCKSARKNLWRY